MALGVRYAADHGADVINLSLGQSASSMLASDLALITDAIAYARSLGVIPVVAAGNEGSDIANAVPAKFDNVISVGALRHQYDIYRGSGPLSRANFSNVGEELDFMAPGVDILSLAVSGTIYSGFHVFSDNGFYYAGSDGTSMAAPMVSGVVALLLAQDPMQSFDDIYRRLKYSVTDMGAVGFDNSYGYGLVNPVTALSHDYYDDGRIKKVINPDTSRIEYTYWDPSGILKNTVQYDSNNHETEFTQHREDGGIFYSLFSQYNELGLMTGKSALLVVNADLNLNISYIDDILIEEAPPLTIVHVRMSDGSNGEQIDALGGSGELTPQEIFQKYIGLYLSADGDSDLDVDADDYTIWRSHYGETGEYAPGDYNGDGSVDAADYTVWRNLLGNNADPVPGDSDDDGDADGHDFLIWQREFGNHAEPAPAVAVVSETQVFGGEGYFDAQAALNAQPEAQFSRLSPVTEHSSKEPSSP